MNYFLNYIGDMLESIQRLLLSSPKYSYLIIGLIFLSFFIGVIKNKKWAIDPNSNHQRAAYNLFGRTLFRWFIGFIFLLGAFGGIINYILL
jgi:hypothetical protein